MTIRVVSLTGAEMTEALPALAALRIEVFHAWPYLYEGTLDYEQNYLEKFMASDRSVLVVAYDGADIVGVATAAPMTQHATESALPFVDLGYDIGKIFYFGESVLKAPYRGRGIGHRFFDEREQHARSFGSFTHAAFCSVVRESTHPMRPTDYLPLDAFWTKRGYTKMEGLITWFDWTDIGDTTKTQKPMQFWMKAL
jgi:GNAT superfamily N-acetyltransferase